MKIVVTILFTFSFITGIAQGIQKIERIDSLLIGKKIKQAYKLLNIDYSSDSLRTIIEPSFLCRGIAGSYENYQFQLVIGRIILPKIFKRNESKEKGMKRIQKYKIIGVSWTNGTKCNHIGDILPQYAYNRFGGC